MNSAGGKRLKAGDTVPYVICEDGSGLAATQRAYHLDEVRESASLRVDTHYYLAQQLHPVVARLCDPVEGMDSARIAACLGEKQYDCYQSCGQCFGSVFILIPIRIRIESGSGVLVTKNWKKCTAKKKLMFFWIKKLQFT
jgi:hypothetical protein